MIVYVEPNYLLELAFEQEQHSECLALLELADAGKITLIIPAFSVGECFERLSRLKQQRLNIQAALRADIRELGRSTKSVPLSEQLSMLTQSLVAGAEDDRQRYDAILIRLLDRAEFIPLTAEVIRDGLATRARFGLSAPDGIVLASVMAHLQQARPAAAVFVNKNRKDFNNPDIKTALGSLGCDLKMEFRAGIGFVRAVLD